MIAFRVSSGRKGVIHNNWPHRGVSFFFGRNEEEGRRCVYHGWKYHGIAATTPFGITETTVLFAPFQMYEITVMRSSRGSSN
jgi:hypothetical protein